MLTSVYSLPQGNLKTSKNSVQKVNIEIGNLHIFWTTGGIFKKFSEIWLMIILKAAKKQNFTLSLENTFLEKQQGEFKLNVILECYISPPPPFTASHPKPF